MASTASTATTRRQRPSDSRRRPSAARRGAARWPARSLPPAADGPAQHGAARRGGRPAASRRPGWRQPIERAGPRTARATRRACGTVRMSTAPGQGVRPDATDPTYQPDLSTRLTTREGRAWIRGLVHSRAPPERSPRDALPTPALCTEGNRSRPPHPPITPTARRTASHMPFREQPRPTRPRKPAPLQLVLPIAG